MRGTSVLRQLLGINQLVVEGFGALDGALLIDVRPSWRIPRCSRCGRRVSGYDQREGRLWRHLDFAGIAVFLQYSLRRVNCTRCGIVVEKVPWNDDVASRFTEDFEVQVAYLAQRSDKTTIENMFAITWRTVGRIIERVMKRERPNDLLEGLEVIGVDELSYRKGHRYITLVVDHRHGRLVWGKEGKSAKTLAAFFDELGQERCQAITVVTIDMSEAYINAVRAALPHAQIVFDRFHVQKLVTDALDKTRRQEWQRLRASDQPGDDPRDIKKLRWALLKNPWDLDSSETERLSALPRRNARLYRAYLLKESFADILDRRQPNVVKHKLEQWLAWACRSRLPAFVRVARTIRRHLDDIVAYIRVRQTNGLLEGLNTKARLITRRAYGFHSAEAALAMIMLCCGGLHLQPVRKYLRN